MHNQYTELNQFTRQQLDSAMIDLYGFDDDSVAEWEAKEDLIADIVHLGNAGEVIAYLG